MKARLKFSSSAMAGGVATALLVTLPAAAQARPVHRVHHHVRSAHYRVVDRAVRGQRHWAANHRRYDRSARVSGTDAIGERQSAVSGGSDIVTEARHWLGGNPTSRRSLWCAAFMNFVLERTGHRGTGSDLANSFASYGQRVSGPQVGAIAVMSRRGGGHVGIVSGFDASGNPIIISGNNGNRVRESTYSAGRIYAYVMP